jgi:glycosyltransferase involved in cell wall biosynthesis
MIEPGLVSTIVPVHDRPAMLVDAVESVLAQSYRPLEILIVDDGSTDDTPAVADALAADHPEVQAIHIPNGGPGVAREAGRRQARGEFVQYLDSDDVLLSEKFQSQVRALSADPESGECYGMTRYID